MAVRVLSQVDKDWTLNVFNNKDLTVSGIAKRLGVSTRTINRVLEEAGVLTKRQAIQDDADKIRKILAKYDVLTPKQLEQILKEHSSGQANLFDQPSSSPIVIETPPVTDGTKFAVAVAVEDNKATVQISFMAGDVMHIVYGATHPAGDSFNGFHLKMQDPEMNLEDIQQFLNACTKEQLAALFFTAGLIKIAEMHVGSVTNATLRHQQAATNGKIHYGQQPGYYKQG